MGGFAGRNGHRKLSRILPCAWLLFVWTFIGRVLTGFRIGPGGPCSPLLESTSGEHARFFRHVCVQVIFFSPELVGTCVLVSALNDILVIITA